MTDAQLESLLSVGVAMGMQDLELALSPQDDGRQLLKASSAGKSIRVLLSGDVEPDIQVVSVGLEVLAAQIVRDATSVPHQG